jgi:hypothetical protein
MKTYKSQLEIDGDIIDNKLVIDDDITFECSFVTTASIICRNIIAHDITSGAIYAWSIKADNITADSIGINNHHLSVDNNQDAIDRYYAEKLDAYIKRHNGKFLYNTGSIVAGNIVTGNIYSANIFCSDIKARNIIAGDIKALNINARTINAKVINAHDIFSTRVKADKIIALDIVVESIKTPNTEEDLHWLDDDIDAEDKSGYVYAKNVIANNINAVSVRATNLMVNDVNTHEIEAGTITAHDINGNELEAGTIAADNIKAVNISSNNIYVHFNIIATNINNSLESGIKYIKASEINADFMHATYINATTINVREISGHLVNANEINFVNDTFCNKIDALVINGKSTRAGNKWRFIKITICLLIGFLILMFGFSK